MYKTWMMKTLLLSASLAMLAACNEKIAPELADASAATTSGSSGGGPTTPTTATNVFKLELANTPTDINPALLGYTLHKANELGTVECSVEEVTDVPDTLDSTRDITCFMEAEEYALFFNGFKIKAVSDAETCDFITTTPNSYYRLQPGVTARLSGAPREVVKFVCTQVALQNFGTSAVPSFGTNSSAFTTLNDLCGKYVNIDGTTAVSFGTLDLSASAVPVALDRENELCSFNYQDDEVNCDEGSYRIHTVKVDAAGTVPVLSAIGEGSVLTECGGNVRECMGGPAKQIVTSAGFNYLAGVSGVITEIPFAGGSTSALNVTRNLDRDSNLHMSNFMRQCSGMPNFTSVTNFNTSPTFSPGYDADAMDEYVRLGTTLPGGGTTQEKDAEHGQFDVIILADDPWRAGIPDTTVAGYAFDDPRRDWSNTRMKAQASHSFECLDRALDVKARIRLVVREWNRNFSPTTQEFRNISDVFSASAKMDAGSAQTNPYLIFDNFNDVADWDDYLVFTNSATNSCSLSTMDATIFPLRSPAWFPGKDH
jgi:hypothetical protein